MDFLPDIISAAREWGPLGAIGVALSAIVAIYRKWIDPIMPAAMSWEVLPKWARLGIVFVFAAGGAAVLALAQGAGWTVALSLALSSAFSAIGIHQVASTMFPGQKKRSLPNGG